MTAPGTVDLDAADEVVATAAVLAGDDMHAVLSLLMVSVATVLLDCQADSAKAVAAARRAGEPLAEMTQRLANLRLADARAEGTG